MSDLIQQHFPRSANEKIMANLLIVQWDELEKLREEIVNLRELISIKDKQLEDIALRDIEDSKNGTF